jgi:hypothetical protein
VQLAMQPPQLLRRTYDASHPRPMHNRAKRNRDALHLFLPAPSPRWGGVMKYSLRSIQLFTLARHGGGSREKNGALTWRGAVNLRQLFRLQKVW